MNHFQRIQGLCEGAGPSRKNPIGLNEKGRKSYEKRKSLDLMQEYIERYRSKTNYAKTAKRS